MSLVYAISGPPCKETMTQQRMYSRTGLSLRSGFY